MSRPCARYLNVVARLRIEGRDGVRTWAVPVVVGASAAREAAGRLSVDAQGRSIVPLPAD